MELHALKPLTLLYIEDEPLIRQNAVEYLSHYCNNILEASNGHEGLRIYERHAPDIIITDIKMPQLDGLALVSKIRQKDTKTPIIIVTAHTQVEYLLKAVELQLIKYVVKPITSAKLNEALCMACDTLTQDRESIIHIDSTLRYDLLNKTIFQGMHLIKLTHNEILLFDLLVTYRHRIVTYEEIEALIWAYEGMSMDALRTLVRALRKKLQSDCVDNISGVGYQLITMNHQG